MRGTITEALIYENQGLRDEALEVYKNILKNDPSNQEARSAIRRLSGLKRKDGETNEQMFYRGVNLIESNELYADDARDTKIENIGASALIYPGSETKNSLLTRIKSVNGGIQCNSISGIYVS